MSLNIPENLKPAILYGGATNGCGTRSDYICCKNAHKVTLVGYTWGTSATTCVVNLLEASDVAASDEATITATVPIWTGIVTTSLDTLTRQTDAASLTIDPDGTDSTLLFVMEWDPAKFSSGLDCLAAKLTTGDASDNMVLLAFIDERYPQVTPPTAITD